MQRDFLQHRLLVSVTIGTVITNTHTNPHSPANLTMTYRRFVIIKHTATAPVKRTLTPYLTPNIYGIQIARELVSGSPSNEFASLRLKHKTPYPHTQRSKRCNLKTEMTSFDVAASVYELNQIITDARIENIYQIDRSILLMRLHKTSQPTLQLLIEAGKRIHLTSYVMEKPFKPPAFCMTLRKYLRNGRITEVLQHEFERIVVIRISTGKSSFQLIAELFGEGNIILVNQQGTITTALAFRKMRDRNILRNETFQHAPSSAKNPIYTKREQMDELKNLGQLEIVRALTKFLSIGGLHAEEVLLRAGVDKNTACTELTKQQLDDIYTQLKNMLSNVTEGKFHPATILDSNGECIDVIPIHLKKYETYQSKPHRTFNEALDEYYTQTTQVGKISTAEREYQRELAKQQRILEDQQKTIEDSRKAIDENRRIGDLLYAHFGELQHLVQQILEEKQKTHSWEQIAAKLNEEKRANRMPAVLLDSLDSKRMVLNISVDGKVFPIQLTRSIQANAAEYYEKMKKAERRLEGAENALRETQSRIQELQRLWTGKMEEVREEAPQKQTKKMWYEKFRWFCSSEGLLVIGGKDAITNEILIKKHLEPRDIVFHADIVGAPFVVVKTGGKIISEQVTQEAAQFAAAHSRAWREMLASVDVYWVHPEQVGKTPPHGQFLEKGSFIIQGVKNYVRNVPLRVGIGLQEKEQRLEVIGGPAKAVLQQTSLYVELVPGRQTGKTLAKQIRGLLFEKAPKTWREDILTIPNEEFMRFVPFWKGEVTLK